MFSVLVFLIVLIFSLGLLSGCGQGGGGATTTTTTATTTSTTTTTNPNLIVASRNPALNTANVLATTEPSATFNHEIDPTVRAIFVSGGMGLDSLITLGSNHTAGDTTDKSATFEFSADGKTVYFRNVTGWSELVAGAGTKTVEVITRANGIKDVNGLYLATGTVLFGYTLAPIPGATVNGSVKAYDATQGGGIRGAQVFFSNDGGATVQLVTADASGNFIANRLTTGTYSFHIEQIGWYPTEETLSVVQGSTTDATFVTTLTSWEIEQNDPHKSNLYGITSLEGEDLLSGEVVFSGDIDGSNHAMFYTPYGSLSNTPSVWTSPTAESIPSLQDGGNMGIIAASQSGFTYAGNPGGSWIRLDSVAPGFPQPMTNENIRQVFVHNETTFEAVTAAGRIIRTDNGGATYSDRSPNFIVKQGYFAENTNWYAVGDNGNAQVSTDFGVTWAPMGDLSTVAGNNETLTSVCVRISGMNAYGIATSASGAIYTSTDSVHWTKELAGLPWGLNASYSNTNGLSGALAAGNNFTVLRRQ